MKYSPEADIPVIELTDKEPVESDYLEKYVTIIDYDESNEVIGIEILD